MQYIFIGHVLRRRIISMSMEVKSMLALGGHLFAIAADKSNEWGYEGAVHGFAANEEQTKNLLEVYHYEWNET